MCNTRNDIIESGMTFWAIDKATGRIMDWTGHCICTSVVPWAVCATDSVGCERIFLRHKFWFEKILERAE